MASFNRPPPIWRYDSKPLVADQPGATGATYDLAATGAQVSTGNADLGLVWSAALDATGTAVSSGNAALSQVMALAATGAAVSSGAAGLNAAMVLAASGVQASTGQADLVILLAGFGLFASRGRPGPYARQRPYWRYDGPLIAGPALGPQVLQLAGTGASASTGNADLFIVMALAATGAATASGTADLGRVWAAALAATGTQAATGTADLGRVWAATLDATGAAASSGNAALSMVMSLGATGAAVGSGAAALSQVMSLAASGAAASVGAGDLIFWQPPLGVFASKARPGPQFRQRPYWRYDAALIAAAAQSGPTAWQLDATGAAVAVGNAALTQTMVLSATGAQASTGNAAFTQTMVLAASGAQASSGAGVLSQVLVLAASGAVVSAGNADFGRVMALAGSGSAVSAGNAAIVIAATFEPGFFASQRWPGPAFRQRPYWRYDGPLTAGVPVIRDISIITGRLQSGWHIDKAGTRWFIITAVPSLAWKTGAMRQAFAEGTPTAAGWVTGPDRTEDV